MATLEQMSEAAQVLSERRAALQALVQTLQDGLEALKSDQLPAIRAAVDAASAAWSRLEQLIDENPHLFVRPRTVSVHGIKFGLAKGQGGMEIADPERTVRLIERHFPEQAEVLIATKKTPAKEALAQLSAADLKKLGVEVRDTGDRVVIKPAGSDVDKLVKALVKEATEDDE